MVVNCCQVEKVAISKHLVKSPVVVLSADYGWTAQMEKVMKSQAFADQSKFEFMKSKRMFEINPRHPVKCCRYFIACVAVTMPFHSLTPRSRVALHSDDHRVECSHQGRRSR